MKYILVTDDFVCAMQSVEILPTRCHGIERIIMGVRGQPLEFINGDPPKHGGLISSTPIDWG